ncbi:tetratricopeptide repeat protein [Pseudofulvimonas gallinarii]|uniref:tetratricopeptide repeat protein n=1 Tax=Pseudofulvimonas gallinarii TaxID=634155 RepID=UPI0013DD988A|nr:tetratricopeptide repeat protein [Pseudofulvimonas gallinarii]
MTADGESVALRRRAFDLLRVLLEQAPALVGRDQILDQVWGHDALTPNVLPQTISEIRHALGDSAQSPRLIETLHRRGYRILVPVERVADAPRAAVLPAEEVPSVAAEMSPAASGSTAAVVDNGGRWRWPLAAAALLLLLALLAAWAWRTPAPSPTPPTAVSASARPSIALMIQSDPQAPAWLSGAGSELLAVALGGDDQVRLLRGDGRSDVPPVGDARWQSWLREVLGADYALTGLWRLENGQPQLSWSLLRLADSQVTHSGRAGDEDLGAVSRHVADDLRRHLQLVAVDAAQLAGLPRERGARDAYYRGLAALADGRSGAAVTELESAAADAGAGARVHLALARAWRAAGHVGKARQQFEAILGGRHGLTAVEQLRLEAELARANNRPADAAASLLALHRMVADDVEVAYDLVDAQIQARQAGAAETVLRGLDTLSSEGSRDPRWHLAQAQLAIMQFKLDEAAAATARAQALAERYGLDELAAQAQLVGVAVDRRRNDPQAAGQRLQQLLAGNLTPAQRVRSLLQQGNLLRDTGDFDGAEQAIEQAIALAGDLGNEAQQMLAHVELHTVKSLRSHSDQTLADLEALEPRIAVLEDAGLLARYFNTLGVQATLNKEIDKAEAYLRRAAAEARKAGQIDNEAGVYNNLGNVLFRNGRTDAAVNAWEQALRVFNEVDNGLGAAITLSNLGGVAVSSGDLVLASEQFQQALDRFIELDSGQHMARTRYDLAQVAERQGRLAAAAGLYRLALDAQREAAGDRALHSAAALARVQLAMAQLDDARAVLDGVAAQLASSSDAGTQARIHAAAGHIALLAGDPQAARSAFDQARSLRETARGAADKVAYSDLDLLRVDLAEARPAGQIRARAESLYRQFVRDSDVHGQLMAVLVQARALLAAERPQRAAPLLDKAETLLAAWPDAALAYELGRLRILADAPLESPGRVRLQELAGQAEAEGFQVLALRSRLDADPADAAALAQVASLGLSGLRAAP